ncbi:MAG: helix-turn-helix transcriptional regulator [Bacteroidales bacterium]|nr:helix-turn-helix transcriptional regulator [Bacteroidales bacterium]
MSLILVITTILFSILFGCAALAISFFMQRRYELDYVKSYFYHQILIFLFGFYGLLGTIITHYLLIDIEIKGEILKHLFSFLPFIGVPFMIAAWYMFIKISFELIEKNLSLKFTIWFFIILLLVFLVFGFLVPFINYFMVDQKQINTHVFLFFIVIELVTLIIVFANYFIFSKNLKDKHKLRFIKFFALVNVLLYAISVVFLLKGEKDFLFISGYTMLYFFKDIIPLLILNRYLNKNYVHPVNIVSGDTRESFIEKFSISKRETEIVNEIILGRSNKEISDRLFISLQTVKDHIHNIYLKTGIKNRVQLTNLIRQFEAK